MATTDLTDLVRRYFRAYEDKDRHALESLLNDRFVFHSPDDPHLDRAGYFERCWPNAERIRSFQIEKLFAQGAEAFVLYECKPMAGASFRNTEFFRVEGDAVSEVQVVYGSLPTTS
jgi:hypothetical protein